MKKRPGVRAKLLEKYCQLCVPVTAEKKEGDSEGGHGDDDHDGGGLKAWIELGDRHPDFVYTL